MERNFIAPNPGEKKSWDWLPRLVLRLTPPPRKNAPVAALNELMGEYRMNFHFNTNMTGEYPNMLEWRFTPDSGLLLELTLYSNQTWISKVTDA